MKKKILLIAVVIFISIGLLSISKVVQDKYLNKDSVVEQQNDLIQKPIEGTPKEDVVANSGSDTTKPIVETKPETDKKTEPEAKVDVKNIETKTPSSELVTPAKDVPKAPSIKVPEPEKQPNFIVKDDISVKTILSLYVGTENKTVAEVTFSELDRNKISYKASGRAEVVYFTMIAGLKARDAGPLSGWCYYVNGTKSSVSCGAYKLKAGDVVSWKYLEDGVNN
jgi:Tfp pilus assembly protein PilV